MSTKLQKIFGIMAATQEFNHMFIENGSTTSASFFLVSEPEHSLSVLIDRLFTRAGTSQKATGQIFIFNGEFR